MKTAKINKSVKLFMAILVLLLGIGVAFTFIGGYEINTFAFALESTQMLSTEKVYSRATIDDNFDGNTAIVVLDRTISGVNKQHSPSFFGNEGIVSIEDLTAVTDRRWLSTSGTGNKCC